MSKGSLSIVLDRVAFEPGERIRGSYHIVTAELSRLEIVEITVGWHTEGKGMETTGVEHREIHRPGVSSLDRNGSGKFSALLPASPLSYDGVLIKVCWAVRLRACFSGGANLDAQRAFRLGHVASVGTEKPSIAER
jgi:hypothetical protein